MDQTGVRDVLISPYGERLVGLLVPDQSLEDLRAYAGTLPSVQISDRSMCDLELLATGGFSPLDRFMGAEDYDRVLDEMRLTSGYIFPIPVTLPVEHFPGLQLDRDVALRSATNDLLAIMTIEEIYKWDRDEVGWKVFGTRDLRHPLITEMRRWGPLNISGRLQVLQLPPRHDFREHRRSPSEVRAKLASLGRSNVVAFQTRNPLHRAHEELTKRAMDEYDAILLLHPSVGMTKPGDIDHYTRVRTYNALVSGYYDPQRTVLSLLPLAMRMAGPREALWHAIIRRNFGANHFIIGRDHAGPGNDSSGQPFYGQYDAHALVTKHSDEIGVRAIQFHEMVYLPDEARFEEVTRVPAGARTASIGGTQVREGFLRNGRKLPEWFTRSEVAEILAESFPPRYRQGVCIWFTGLSGSGKSTTADLLTVLLLEHGRQVTLLDGDVVRTHLSKGLGFSSEDRDINIRRIGFVASEIVRHGGIAVCAAISPYRATRNEVRSMVEAGPYVEVFVDTPLEICEARDTKGLYAKARLGEIQDFTGIDSPYEPPLNPEITLDTVSTTPEENARQIVQYLIEQGLIRVASHNGAEADLESASLAHD